MKRTQLAAAASIALVAVLALAGCSIIPDSAAAPAPSASAGPRGGAGTPGGVPGVTGQVAQVDGSTAQVQSRTSQTAVTWTSATTFTDQEAAASGDVAVGDCIVARPAADAGRSASSAAVAAATVEITPKTDGRCTTTGFGARQTQPGVRPTPAPGQGRSQSQGRGSATPRPGGFGGGGFGAVGEVTAIGAGSYTVSVQRFARTSGGATPNPSATPSTTTETVTWTSSTTFTALKPAGASAVQVGLCVTALGKADDTGAVTATSVAVSKPVDGTCSAGFGGFGGRGGNGSGGTGSGSSGTTNG
jgi:hypothetical protein